MIATFHASGELLHMWTRPALRSMMQRVKYRVAVSEAARETAEANWSGEYSVLWNGIEIDRFATATPTATDRPAVLFLGRHEPRKGLSVLLDAWEGIDRDAVLWVAGTGGQTDELQSRRVPGVEWLGSIPDPERNARLRGATVFCAPSLGGESFGIVLLEAMAAGTPIVASAIDGYQNVARADLDALLVPPGDVRMLREALQRLLDDDGQREKLVASGEARAQAFAMSRLAARYLELYERALVPA
jgi:phosphatidylinositol alpha-mannosyltransferase